MVLLKNEAGVLPLAGTPGRQIAVIGEFARTFRFQGAGSSQVSPTRIDVPLDELTGALPAAHIRYAPGFRAAGQPAGAAGRADTDALAAQALSTAAGADVIVVFLGLPAAAESEGFDRTHIDLPDEQVSLLLGLAGQYPQTPVVAVLCHGAVVRTSTWDHAAAAVLECWLGGQAAGAAVSDVLTGAVSPSGRLAETIPVRLADCPSYLNFPGAEGHVRYGEGVFAGYRGFDAVGLPVAYPFGHGLSYTRFGYRGLQLEQAGSAGRGDLAITVACTVSNDGDRAGAEVVQLYVGARGSAVPRPPRELRGFAKISLAAGAEQQVRFTLTARDLSYWSVARSGWVAEPGEIQIAVGASSRDIRLSEVITVAAGAPSLPLSGESTLAEWLADPDGARMLRAAVGTSAGGRPAGVLANPELLRVIGSFPLARMPAFPGLGITAAVIEALTSQLQCSSG